MGGEEGGGDQMQRQGGVGVGGGSGREDPAVELSREVYTGKSKKGVVGAWRFIQSAGKEGTWTASGEDGLC